MVATLGMATITGCGVSKDAEAINEAIQESDNWTSLVD